MLIASTVGRGAIILGALGLVLHGALATVSTPILYNHFLSLWFAGTLISAGAQLVYAHAALETASVALVIYSAICSLMSLVAGICWAVDLRFDVTAWALLQCITFAAAARVASAPQVAGSQPAAHATKDNDPEAGDRPGRGCMPFRASSNRRAKACALATSRGVHVFVLLFLTYGSTIAALSATAYAAEGSFLNIETGRGQTLSLHYLCADPPSDAADPGVTRPPPVWITSSPAHGVADFLGLQHYLTLKGFRVCAVDPPGFDHSGRAQAATLDVKDYLPPLVRAVEGADTPIAIAAWGGGGSGAVAIANEGSLSVAAVVFMTVYAPDVEWTTYQDANDLTDAETKAYRNSQLTARVSFAQTILGFVVPWGLWPLFAPVIPAPSNFYPKDKFAALRLAIWRPKLWVNQYWGIRTMLDVDDDQDPLAAGAPLRNNVPLASIACKVSEPTQAQAHQLKTQDEMVKALDENAVLIYNTDDECGLSLPVNEPEWTAGAVRDALVDMLS